MSDYIKREDATAVVRKTLGSLGNSVVTEINSLSGYVADRPTVDKEYLIDLIQEAVYDGEACAKLMDMVDRPTGRWEVVDATEPRRYGCSKCKRLSWDMSNYCGYCGADMRGENHE